jgi:hypothetical protein
MYHPHRRASSALKNFEMLTESLQSPVQTSIFKVPFCDCAHERPTHTTTQRKRLTSTSYLQVQWRIVLPKPALARELVWVQSPCSGCTFSQLTLRQHLRTSPKARVLSTSPTLGLPEETVTRVAKLRTPRTIPAVALARWIRMALRSLPAAGLRFHARLVRALPSARAPVAAVVPESTGLNVATVSHLAAVSALFMRAPPPTTLVYPFPALPLHTHPH